MTLLDLDAPSLPPMLCLGGCGHYLWSSKSRNLGYGPECAANLGISIPPSPRISRRDGGQCEGQSDLLEPAMPDYITTDASDFYHDGEDCPAFQRGHRGVHEIRGVTAEQARDMEACQTCLGQTSEGTTA